MRRIDRVLPNALPQRAIAHAAEAWLALHRWEEIVGAPLAARSWPDRFEKGTVWVAVSGSEWSQELRMKKPLILERLRAMLGGRDLVRDVRFGVRPLPERPEPPPQPKKPRRADTGEEIGQIVARILKSAPDDS